MTGSSAGTFITGTLTLISCLVGTTRVRVLAALAGLLLAGLAGCSGAVPRSGPGLPIPVGTPHHLPAGVFYLLAGWPNAYSANIWEVTPSGREVQLTHNRVGYGVSWFSASSAGIVMADASNGVDELARLTPHGAEWLPAGHARQPEIGGESPQIAGSGEISYVVPPANYGPAHNDNAVWVTPSFSAPGRIVYQQVDDLGGLGFGPSGQIAVMNRPYDPPIHGKPAHILIISPSGKVAIVYTPFTELGTLIWQPNAIALAVSAVSGRTELIFGGNRREMLPGRWQPLSWSPAGDELLVQHGLTLGVWSPSAPRQVAVIARTNRNFAVLNVDWLSSRAPL
jgi:hypothetical protein